MTIENIKSKIKNNIHIILPSIFTVILAISLIFQAVSVNALDVLSPSINIPLYYGYGLLKEGTDTWNTIDPRNYSTKYFLMINLPLSTSGIELYFRDKEYDNIKPDLSDYSFKLARTDLSYVVQGTINGNFVTFTNIQNLVGYSLILLVDNNRIHDPITLYRINAYTSIQDNYYIYSNLVKQINSLNNNMSTDGGQLLTELKNQSNILNNQTKIMEEQNEHMSNVDEAVNKGYENEKNSFNKSINNSKDKADEINKGLSQIDQPDISQASNDAMSFVNVFSQGDIFTYIKTFLANDIVSGMVVCAVAVGIISLII